MLIDKTTVYALKIVLPKTTAPLFDVKFQHKIEGAGTQWSDVAEALNIDYDFGEGIHLLKASSTSGKVEWEIPQNTREALDIHDYRDGVLRFGAAKAGSFTLTAKVGDQKKEFTLHITEAAQPRVEYKLETENKWYKVTEEALDLVIDRPVLVRIDNGADGWNYVTKDQDQQPATVSKADNAENTWKIMPKKVGDADLIFALGEKNVNVKIKVEQNLPKVYFLGKDGNKTYLNKDNKMLLTVLDEGEFHMEGDNLKALRWDAKEKYYLTDTRYAFHFWIDQFSRYNPRKSGTQNASVIYQENGKTQKYDFVIEVLPSKIEAIKAYVGGKELTTSDPIQVQGSERTHIVVKGKVAGQDDFKVLPETAYRLKDQDDQHIMGSSFALWKPGTFNVNVFMRDNPAVQTNFSV